MNLKYEIVIWWSKEDEVYVPELPGCMTHGDTYEEAVEMAKDAMTGWIEVAQETGHDIPEPKGHRVALAA
jgi:predicted RNase H-like HicB family nuclease